MNIKIKKNGVKKAPNQEEAVDLEKEVEDTEPVLSSDQVEDKSEESNVSDIFGKEEKEIEVDEINPELIIKDLTDSNKGLNDENTKLTNEINAYKDRLVKTLAEYENFRKRTAKEKEEIYNSACEDILKNVFPILDNIERAASIEGAPEDIKKGLDMTLKQFNESLSKLQVEEIDASGEFDPNIHNAVMHVEDENIGKNTVVEVFQKGYKRGNKVLRHSMVKVVN